MREIELIEETDLEIPKGDLSEHLASAFYSDNRFELTSPPGQEQPYRLRSSGWVGHIPVADILAIVTPKVPIQSIFGMLEVAYKLKSFDFFEGETAVRNLEEIYERIAAVLAKRVNDRLRKGLYRSYIEHTDDLQYVRGRIDIRGNIRNALVGAPALRCHFEELTADLKDNAILLWALNVASRVGLQRENVSQEVRRAHRGLSGAVSLSPIAARDCVGQFYHRLNDDYQPMHGLARFLIEHAGPSAERGDREVLPFAVNMPDLFETFVAEWLRENLPEDLKVDPQYHAKLEANAELSFRIDLVLRDRRSGDAIAVLDTKYKLRELPSQADIQQVLAYAVEMGVDRAFLIYPRRIADPIQMKVGNIEVKTLGFDLSVLIEAAGEEFLASLVTAH